MNITIPGCVGSFRPPQGAGIRSGRVPRIALRLSWAIIDSSLRDDGTTQPDEAEETSLLHRQKHSCDALPAVLYRKRGGWPCGNLE